MNFETFYSAAMPRLRGQLRRQFPRKADLVEDALQHACLKAVQSTRPIDDLTRFVVRVATNYIIDGVRGDRRFAPNTEDFDPAELPAPASSYEEEEERERTRKCAELALTQVGEPSRSLVLMKHVEGHDYQHIARALGLSPGSVGTTLLRARRRVRQLAMDCLGKPEALA